MASRIETTTFDAHDPYALAVWWADVLAYHEDSADPNAPEHDECLLLSPDESHKVLFIRVPDVKTVKNRIHFDLRPTDRTRDAEINRIMALGASMVDDLRDGPDTSWAVLGDPEGNEFCVLQSESERAVRDAAGDT